MYSASPSLVRQAPDFKALMKNAISVIEGQPLATEPIAQEYFEPGVNKRLVRRSKPKTNYTLPSDMPSYPMGFVPTNKTPGANGEEPAYIHVPEAMPADLMEVFAKIAKEQDMAPRLPVGKMDHGTRTTRAYMQSLQQASETKKMDGMIRNGFTPEESKKAMDIIREEEALRMARKPAAPLSVEEAMKEAFGGRTGDDDEPTAP